MPILSSDQKAQWQEQGFLILRGVYSPEESKALASLAEDLALGRRPFPKKHIELNAKVSAGVVQAEGLAALHKIHYPHFYNAEFLDRVRDPRVVDVVEELLGPDLLGIPSLFIFKPPQIGMGFPWHQDKAFFDQIFVTETTVATSQAVDPSTVENGCLWVIPGSHRGDVKEHHEQKEIHQSEYREAKGVDEGRAVPVEMEPGDVLFFHGYLLHKSTDNQSAKFRRCYVAHYMSARARYAKEGEVWAPPISIRGRTFEGCVQAHVQGLLPVDSA